MAEAVRGTRRAYSMGSLMMYVQPLILVSNSSTHASGLDSVVGFWANATSETASPIKAGVDISNSSGTFTISHGEADLKRNIDLFILTTELE